MKFSDVLRFFYGLSMGTSTQYLRPTKRPLFAQSLVKIDENFFVQIGGTENCGILIDDNKNVLLIDSGGLEAAGILKKQIEALSMGLKVKSIIFTHYHRHAAEGGQLFSDLEKIYLGPYIKEKFPADVRNYLGNYFQIDSGVTEIKWGKEQIQIHVVENGHTQCDLVIELKHRKYVFMGGLFYNQIHPELSELDIVSIPSWSSWLKEFAEYVSEKHLTVVPGEGELVKDAGRILEFSQYLSDLNNGDIEFSRCRELYDWREIVGISSLAQNFDFLRYKYLSHTTLTAHRD